MGEKFIRGDDIWVHPERILRIVRFLEIDQSVVVIAVSSLRPLLFIFAEVIHVHIIGRVG